jgi:protease-4
VSGFGAVSVSAREARACWVSFLAGMLVTALVAHPAGATEPRPFPDYPSEVDLLVDTPGTSSSIAAGLFNPAAWAMQRSGGLFLGWRDATGHGKLDDWTGVASLRGLAFGVRRFGFEGADGGRLHVDDYTLGISGGRRAGTMGLSYSWAKGDLPAAPRHERIAIGTVSRIRQASLGIAQVWDLERRDHFLQMDFGLRPLGPRLTLFGDAVYERGQSFHDIRTGYGLEARLLPGLTLAAKARSTGEISLGASLGFAPHGTASFRPHLDDGGERVASTYALELGPATPVLGRGVLGVGSAYPEMHFKGSVAYQRYRFFDDGRTLLGTLRQIDAMACDPAVQGIVINLSGMSASLEVTWEIREQLAGLRARGKTIVVYVDEPSQSQYMLATVADQIWIDSQGGLDLRGVALGRTFYRHALDKAGLGVDEWRFFTYKSAFESYSRDSMSEADRKQRQDLADDLYETLAQAATSGRGIARTRWDQLVNEHGIFRPEEAQAVGLVDSIGSFDKAKAAARRATPRPLPVDPMAAQLAGLTGDPVWGPQEWGEPARIAVLYAIGECAMDTGIRARTLSKEIQKVRENRNVKAVVLRADSPGGDPLASDLVARELRLTSKKKPVLVSQGQVAGSGGYWISMYGDTIVASPATITGSIGVIGGWIWNKGFGEKTGLSFDKVQHGEHADLGTGMIVPFIGELVPERNLTPEERSRMEEIFRGLYKDFVHQVATGRGLRESFVDSIGQGHFYSGSRGQKLGLVDQMGGLWYTLQLAKIAAHLSPSRAIELDEGPSRGMFDLNAIFRPRLFGDDASLGARLAASPLTEPERLYLHRLVGARGRPLLMMEPLEIDDGAPKP